MWGCFLSLDFQTLRFEVEFGLGFKDFRFFNEETQSPEIKEVKGSSFPQG